MAKSAASPFPVIIGIVEIKSKFDADIRRFSIDASKTSQFDDFYLLLEQLHHLVDIPFIVTYTDPRHMDLLPINNNDNFSWALAATKGILKVVIQRKGESYGEVNGYAAQPVKKRNPISKLVSAETSPRPKITISLMEDFRRVSAIIDVDIVPETHRRVKLMKNGSDKPLGFYIRDGTSVRMTPHGLEKVPAIFISRLVPGGLAESTGLLAVNDEVLEVNGIEVAGKKLDQVTDMMVANSSNLIITVKPVNQRMTLATQRGGLGRHSNISSTSHASHQSQASNVSVRSYGSEQLIPEGDDDDDDDEVEDHLSPTLPPPGVLALDEASGGVHAQLRDDLEDGRKQGSGGKGARPKSSAGSKGALAVSSSAEGGDKDSDPIVTL